MLCFCAVLIAVVRYLGDVIVLLSGGALCGEEGDDLLLTKGLFK